jgi:hypothetical protein
MLREGVLVNQHTLTHYVVTHTTGMTHVKAGPWRLYSTLNMEEAGSSETSVTYVSLHGSIP